MRRVLGISCDYHDAAACLLEDGRVVAAAQEERFTREKHDSRLPVRAIAYCLREAGAAELDAVAFYDKPILKLHRILETSLRTAPRGLRAFVRAVPVWLRHKLWIEARIHEALERAGVRGEPRVWFPEHHLSHAASAFFPSPFAEAAVVTLDGVGEWATTTVGVGEGGGLSLLSEIEFPHSLGLLYSAFTFFCGFEVLDGEYKLMGLAPYGEPRFVQAIRDELIDLRDDGSFRLNLDCFGYLSGDVMTNARFARLFGGPPRTPESEITQREKDLARSVQEVTEEAVLRIARHARELTGKRSLCMAGGVALNCVANGRLLGAGVFDDLWIQPAAGDAGGALGAAFAVHHGALGGRRDAPRDEMRGALLGPCFSTGEMKAALDAHRLSYETIDDDHAWAERVAALVASEKVVGLFQGRMEFGPRALGNRSIVADPRSPAMQSVLNRKIKRRESFRPFAPSVLEDRAGDWFDLDRASPYMLRVAPVRGDGLPAVTHVDGSARVQTVGPDDNPRYHALLRAFEARTGCPVLVNTSFNVRGEPIVCTPEDACRCFLDTEMDALSLGPFLVVK